MVSRYSLLGRSSIPSTSGRPRGLKTFVRLLYISVRSLLLRRKQDFTYVVNDARGCRKERGNGRSPEFEGDLNGAVPDFGRIITQIFTGKSLGTTP